MTISATVDQDTGRIKYESDGHVVYVGPHIDGHVFLPDGTRYNVTPNVIEVASLEHASMVAHAIAQRFVEDGHPMHDDANPFLHHCTAACGPAALPVSDPMAAAGAIRAQLSTSAIIDAEARAHHAAAMGTGPGDILSAALAGTAAENAALNGLDGTGSTNVIPDVSLHVATPGTTGASENANAGSYARQAGTWNAASSGAKTNATSLVFSTLGTIAVTYFGTWSSATYGAGNWAIGGQLVSAVTAVSITFAAGAISLGAS